VKTVGRISQKETLTAQAEEVKEAGAAAGAEEISRIGGALEIRERVLGMQCKNQTRRVCVKLDPSWFLESHDISKKIRRR
jgi:hypothetical protein